jgi:hypothetical protein
MSRRPFLRHVNDATMYLVVNDFGQFSRAFVETDVAEADRETIIRKFIAGQYSDATRVVAFNTAGAGLGMRLRTSRWKFCSDQSTRSLAKTRRSSSIGISPIRQMPHPRRPPVPSISPMN